MRRLLILVLVAVTSSLTLSAPPENDETTKLESFLANTGTLVAKRFHDVGTIKDAGQSRLPICEVTAIVLTSPGTEAAVKGLQVEVGKGRAFLDQEEIADLISAIEYMITHKNQLLSQAGNDHIEIVYSTKGNLLVGYYKSKDADTEFIKAGRIGAETKRLPPHGLELLHGLLKSGSEFLAAR